MAMQRSRLVLRRYRENRREAVRQMVGFHWSEEGSKQTVPVNLIAQYVGIVGPKLIAKAPRVSLSTFDRAHKATVSACQSWANKEIEDLRLANTYQRVVLDALFSIGVLKVALGTPADAARMSWTLGAGSVFAERVDLDDFVFDIHARDFQEVSFIGHRFRVPLEAIRDSKIYSKARKELEPSYDPPYNLEGDERISLLGRTYLGVDTEEFEDAVDLWEVYLPRHRLVLTLADDSLTGPSGTGAGGPKDPLREQRWLGPDSGPYHVLAYGLVPGNVMPKSPVMDLIDQHLFANNLYRKLMRQAERQKDNLWISGGADADGNRIVNADDGEAYKVDNPEKIRPTSLGGPNQSLLAMFQQNYDLFNRTAGNLELMGGTAPQSRTLGQDKMLNANASGLIQEMQETTTNFVSASLKAMCWYWWHDPYKVMRTTHSLPGMPEFSIPRRVHPAERQKVNFADLDIRVDPYSTRAKSPEERLQQMNMVVTQIVIPMMQLLVQQGINFDMNAYLQKVGQYLDMPDLADILTIMEPPEQDSPSAGGHGRTMPQSTSRSYERHSSGAASRYGMDLGRINAMKPNGQNGTPQPSGMGQ